MNNTDLEQLKDKYAMGTLSAEEQASLQVEILQNPKIENELEMHKDLVNGVNYAGELELRELLDKVHYEYTSDKSRGIRRYNVALYIAGLLSLIAVIAYFVLTDESTTKSNPTAIYAEFYTQYQPSLQNRGGSKDEAIVKFNKEYIAGNHDLALQTIKPYLVESSNEIKLIAAISANEINDLVLAERLLDDIIADNDYYFTDHAIWYKALIKLKRNEIDQIKEILTPLIANPKADHHDNAVKMVAQLKG